MPEYGDREQGQRLKTITGFSEQWLCHATMRSTNVCLSDYRDLALARLLS